MIKQMQWVECINELWGRSLKFKKGLTEKVVGPFWRSFGTVQKFVLEGKRVK